MGLKPSDTPNPLESDVIKTPDADHNALSESVQNVDVLPGHTEIAIDSESLIEKNTKDAIPESLISSHENTAGISASPVFDSSSGNTMSTPTSSLSNTQAQAPSNAQRPGERLRQARLFKQRELKDIASELNIPERLLVAIEADEYKSLPEPAFIRGYLRSYARVLGIDSDILITQFNEIYTSATGLSSNHSLENSPLQQLAKLHSKTRKSKRWMLWLLVPVVLVIIVLLLRPVVKRVMNSPSSNDTHAVVLNENTHADSNSTGNIITSSTSQAPLSALPSPATSANDQLVLTFSKSSDVIVQDASGKTLTSGVHNTDEPLTLSGTSPFSITLADAPSVSLALNGEQVDLKPYTVNGRAAFRLSR
ncbi:helix-turn-helix domain-containing protein [Aquirhabdus sp.]|uniref:helix-turn-helix domain-containing protein n=1 Tax=Aquirhabdus sp. TaxID=2824160 RepID=UPI00396C853B